MDFKRPVRMISLMLVTLMILLPAQVALSQADSGVERIDAEITKVVTTPAESVEAVESDTELTADVPILNDDNKKIEVDPALPETKETTLSTGAIVGISVGAVLLVGGIVALASGSGGSSGSDAGSSSSSEPLTANQLVDAWNATADQPGSGLTYTGTYQLYDGGSIAYNIYISDGEHLVGGGSWSLDGYKLSIHTDHGSLYSGSFSPGNITSVNLNSNTGWNLNLSR